MATSEEERAERIRRSRKKKGDEVWAKRHDIAHLTSIRRDYVMAWHQFQAAYEKVKAEYEEAEAEFQRTRKSRSATTKQRAEDRYLRADAKRDVMGDVYMMFHTFGIRDHLPRSHPDIEHMEIVCSGGNLRWTNAKKEHFCVECGEIAAKPREDYLRNEHHDSFQGTEAWCLECAWRLFGPEGSREKSNWQFTSQWHDCGRGCLLDGRTPEYEAARNERSASIHLLMEKYEKGDTE